ncbi:MAG: hypothetical protein KatS3mg115_1875 [Candidatus Poribacteria bacterium]|nr:MAG: hypothetical protein KatS3mg115_1875 [Candidatus Poribacteria bacterium]
MTPVMLLSDGYIGNGAEPWRIPDLDELPPIEVKFADDPETFAPYARDPETLARPWAVPGTPGLEHRVGGLEKEDVTGNISYDPVNHEKMVEYRRRKVEGIAREIPPTQVFGEPEGELLVIGWGSTYGAIRTAVEDCQADGLSVSWVHLRWLNPFPSDLGEIIRRFRKVLIPELNSGQLATFIRAKYLVDAIPFSKVQGLPFWTHEIEGKIRELIG